MGVRSGDRLLEVNRQPVAADNVLPIMAVLADLRSGVRRGETVRVQVSRGGKPVELTGKLEPWMREMRVIAESPSASATQVEIRERLFGPSRGAPASAPSATSAAGGS